MSNIIEPYGKPIHLDDLRILSCRYPSNKYLDVRASTQIEKTIEKINEEIHLLYGEKSWVHSSPLRFHKSNKFPPWLRLKCTYKDTTNYQCWYRRGDTISCTVQPTWWKSKTRKLTGFYLLVTVISSRIRYQEKEEDWFTEEYLEHFLQEEETKSG